MYKGPEDLEIPRQSIKGVAMDHTLFISLAFVLCLATNAFGEEVPEVRSKKAMVPKEVSVLLL